MILFHVQENTIIIEIIMSSPFFLKAHLIWGNWKIWEYQTTWPASWEACMQVRKQQLELDMEQQTGSK